ncbi:acetolactate synthase small subunit [Thraustotheca clavata]|uniref:Acetolactate synthase small subunit n=1 Tax=Thraustotheca clavata TaxID=74557 RepID=A0A1W0ACR2_9STRA|nr:acetolactate synthase small subunit [Thraustotheca clavata]
MLLRSTLVRRFSELSRSRRHVIAALVVNQTGCLAEIANLFAARGYNIDSLVVGRTDVPELSRMSVVVHGTDQNVWNMKKQLEDVVQVAAVKILTGQEEAGENVIERDLMLAKVSTHLPGSRSEVAELASLFDAKVVDVTPSQVMVQLAGTPPRIEAFLELLKPMGIVEIHRSGVIAMDRVMSVTDKTVEIAFQAQSDVTSDDEDEMDVSKLPPG